MIRLPSSFALAAWAGFHAITAATQLAAAVGYHNVFGLSIDGPAARGAEQALLIGLSSAAATISAMALRRLHAPTPAAQRSGEGLAFVSAGVSSGFVLAALLFEGSMGAVVTRPDLAIWALGLTVVALTFDNCMFAPDDPDDEREFQCALRLIDASIPRRSHMDEVSERHEEVS